MIIKELNIKAFGRFSDRTFKLGDGLNIIYGPNETGKSTLHQFIEAMFYGFVKPGVKRRVMTEQYNQYRPWTGHLYGGSLVYQVGGRLYRVERNLEKGRESVRVFDGVTGEDITGSFGYDRARREVLFAREHLGLSQAAYKNTVSIGQLGSKSDSDLALEIQTRLGNLGSTGSADLSVGRAEKLIRDYLDGIGTERARAKEYGRLCRRIGELEEGLEEAATAARSIRSSGQRLRQMETEAARLKKERQELERKIRECEENALLERWAEIQDLTAEYESLAAQLEEYSSYRDFDPSYSGELSALEQLADQNRREAQRLRLKIEETDRDIEEKNAEISRAGIPSGRRPTHRQPTRRGLITSYIFCGVSAAAALGTVLMAAALQNPSLNILLIPLLVLLFYSLARAVKQRKLLREREGVARDLATERQYMERYRQDLLDTLSAKGEELAKREQRICAILEGVGAGSIEEYRQKAAGFERYTLLKERFGQIKRLLEIRLDGESAAALEERVRAVLENGEATATAAAGAMAAGAAAARVASAGNHREQLAEWMARLQGIREQEVDLLGSMENTRGGMETLEKASSNLPEMEEELSRARDRVQQLRFEREAAGITLETLHEASAGVHREFAPALNRKVTGITSRITGGKYTDLRITKDLEILATAPETGRRVEAEALSGGTVDQLYFALRIAASELLSDGRKLPLILDDCFVQYDWHRLENAMVFLLEEARERQIILFTCHHREKQVADALGEVYNYLIID
ncbi:MAG: ATP-binding protein [Clostridia bacterium]|jgi:uncharacterized protein YhaN